MIRIRGRLRRRGIANPRIYGAIYGAFCAMCRVPVSARHNALYGAADFHRCMLGACLLARSVSSAAAVSALSAHGRLPGALWVRRAIHRMDATEMGEDFDRMVYGLLSATVTGGLARRGIVVAIDKHNIPRYDSGDRSHLSRGRFKRGTTWAETYMSAQVVTRGVRFQLAAVPMRLGDRNAECVRRIMETVLSHGVRVRLVLMDREFFSADVLETLDSMGASYLVPCPNRPGVTASLRDYAAGRIGDVSETVVTRTDGTTVPYTMVIKRRLKREREPGTRDSGSPEARHIAFATNVPGGCDPDEEYPRRWGIESGYASLEGVRVRTSSRDSKYRLFCFLYTMMAYNAWVLAKWELAAGQRLGRGAGREPTLVEFMAWIGGGGSCVRPRKPPPWLAVRAGT